ncbi:MULTISPECIES: response regulator [Roseateles]|uniref:Response regulator n=1 Tax=Roseateles albus TaxID=2987525 RepID=A0ABT5KHK7_9BURK|nr:MULTISPECIES: response regulator [Roseateles]MCV2358143.1 response regulator [Paucibacter sp. TC2R-5]MDC8772440.1 response regulator [Roseateles albus]
MSADLRFLVVDGLAGVQTFARQMLEGFGLPAECIRSASDPEAGLAIGRDFKPDFLITDWFPKGAMTGIALHERLNELNPGCRLALLSFEVTPQHEADAIEAGSNFLLRKPFTAAELKATMLKALEALAKERPELHARLSAVMKSAQPAGVSRPPPKIVLPVIPSLKAGDKVSYLDKTQTVQYVVVSQGELVVQLNGNPGLIPASKLKKL